MLHFAQDRARPDPTQADMLRISPMRMLPSPYQATHTRSGWCALAILLVVWRLDR